MTSNRNLENLVIGLDASTTGTKAIAFDRSGTVRAHAHEPLTSRSPHPGFYEQNPADWWRSARTALQTITRQVDPRRIVALAIANQRETFVPLDARGRALRPAILWLDERCKDEVAPFARRIGAARIHRITGKPPDYAPVVYRLAWMKEHEPGLFRRTAMIADVHTYLVAQLAGKYKTSWASADPLGLFDLRNKRWSVPILRALGLEASQLPEPRCPGTVLGSITTEAARSTGLRPGTFILAGGGDGQCAGLGAGVLSSDRAYLNLGTAVVAGVYSDRYQTRSAFRTMAGVSGGEGYYFECSLRAGTFALDWFLDKVLGIAQKDRRKGFAELEAEAARVPAGSSGLLHLPYLCGAMNPYWDMQARGAFVGLTPAHTRGHMYRAILEGIAFEQRLALEAVERVTGETIREIVAIGGGTTSPLWQSILANVTGKPLSLPRTTEASALGAAIVAATGAGWYATVPVAAAQMTGIRSTIEPKPSAAESYRRWSEEYRRLYPALKSAGA